MSAAGTSVWTGRALQAESDDLEVIGLALLYPALERNVCVPGHHGYPRASDLILGKAQRGRSQSPKPCFGQFADRNRMTRAACMKSELLVGFGGNEAGRRPLHSLGQSFLCPC